MTFSFQLRDLNARTAAIQGVGGGEEEEEGEEGRHFWFNDDLMNKEVEKEMYLWVNGYHDDPAGCV